MRTVHDNFMARQYFVGEREVTRNVNSRLPGYHSDGLTTEPLPLGTGVGTVTQSEPFSCSH